MTLPEDAKLLLLHMPAGRDPRRWENPGTYDITRDVVGKHLGLGFGVHACVGARVARLEGVSLLSALARHVASIELAGRAPGDHQHGRARPREAAAADRPRLTPKPACGWAPSTATALTGGTHRGRLVANSCSCVTLAILAPSGS